MDKSSQASFNPRSPCGERRRDEALAVCMVVFQPTLPLRGATTYTSTIERLAGFQPTLPLRGATGATGTLPVSNGGFNPRSPCGERRAKGWPELDGYLFQPTLPLRGATSARRKYSSTSSSFNPRSPCGERRGGRRADVRRGPVSTHAPLAGSDEKCDDSVEKWLVSTHAPLAGSDDLSFLDIDLLNEFQPTHPLRGATSALRKVRVPNTGFNPRSPCGGRRHALWLCTWSGWFQPTLPLRGATAQAALDGTIVGFQPTLPLRGATQLMHDHNPPYEFQPTLPLRGATRSLATAFSPTMSFNPRSPCGERRLGAASDIGHKRVSTHAPLAGSDTPPLTA